MVYKVSSLDNKQKKYINFLVRQAEVRDYYGAVILYNFFEHFNIVKWKNSKLESCTSRWELQFLYKNHLHPMSYRRVMIFQRFSRNKLEKKKQNHGNCSKSGFTVANRGRTVPCKPCKTGLDLGWTGSQVRGGRYLVSKFMDLFDTALQVSDTHIAFYSWIFLLLVDRVHSGLVWLGIIQLVRLGM